MYERSSARHYSGSDCGQRSSRMAIAGTVGTTGLSFVLVICTHRVDTFFFHLLLTPPPPPMFFFGMVTPLTPFFFGPPTSSPPKPVASFTTWQCDTHLSFFLGRPSAMRPVDGLSRLRAAFHSLVVCIRPANRPYRQCADQYP